MGEASVDNGVNVQALLDARTALADAPEATKFTWRASCKWQDGTFSKSTVEGFHGLAMDEIGGLSGELVILPGSDGRPLVRGIPPGARIRLEGMGRKGATVSKELLVQGPEQQIVKWP